MGACFLFSLAYIYRVRDSSEMDRDSIAIQWSAPQSSLSAPTYIRLNLQPEMEAGPPQAKRLRYFGPAADPKQPASGAQTHPF